MFVRTSAKFLGLGVLNKPESCNFATLNPRTPKPKSRQSGHCRWLGMDASFQGCARHHWPGMAASSLRMHVGRRELPDSTLPITYYRLTTTYQIYYLDMHLRPTTDCRLPDLYLLPTSYRDHKQKHDHRVTAPACTTAAKAKPVTAGLQQAEWL